MATSRLEMAPYQCESLMTSYVNQNPIGHHQGFMSALKQTLRFFGLLKWRHAIVNTQRHRMLTSESTRSP
eukprot:9480697-Pyramimonas_sp.AAC.1